MKHLGFWALSCAMIALPAAGQTPLISYQGYLETGGVPLTGSHNLTCSLWANPSGGTSPWSETHSGVNVENGVFEVVMGSHTSLVDIDLVEYDYLQVAVDGTVLGPRTQLAAVPYALNVFAPTTMLAYEEEGHVLKLVNREGVGSNYGLYAETASPDGIGVYGEVSSTDAGSGYGVAGVSRLTSVNTAGVYGKGAWGVLGESVYGPGVFGKATNSSGGSGIGVMGETLAEWGVGVLGYSKSNAPGVKGYTESATGYGGVFEGGTALLARSVDNATPDLVLGGLDPTDANDDGKLSANSFSSSDLILTSNDDVEIYLDDNGDEGANGRFYIFKRNPTEVMFAVDNMGNVTANGGATISGATTLHGETTVNDNLNVNGDVWVDGVLQHISDRERKEDFGAVDPDAILNGIAGMEIGTWRFRGDSALHLGPMAQDFSAAFGLGDQNTTISTVDADGVALVAIQALHRMVLELRADNAALREELRQMKSNGE